MKIDAVHNFAILLQVADLEPITHNMARITCSALYKTTRARGTSYSDVRMYCGAAYARLALERLIPNPYPTAGRAWEIIRSCKGLYDCDLPPYYIRLIRDYYYKYYGCLMAAERLMDYQGRDQRYMHELLYIHFARTGEEATIANISRVVPESPRRSYVALNEAALYCYIRQLGAPGGVRVNAGETYFPVLYNGLRITQLFRKYAPNADPGVMRPKLKPALYDQFIECYSLFKHVDEGVPIPGTVFLSQLSCYGLLKHPNFTLEYAQSCPGIIYAGLITRRVRDDRLCEYAIGQHMSLDDEALCYYRASSLRVLGGERLLDIVAVCILRRKNDVLVRAGRKRLGPLLAEAAANMLGSGKYTRADLQWLFDIL